MKLAEAIQEKTNLKKTISDLRERLEKAAGAAEKTNENPVRLLGDLEESLKRMERLGAAIYHMHRNITQIFLFMAGLLLNLYYFITSSFI